MSLMMKELPVKAGGSTREKAFCPLRAALFGLFALAPLPLGCNRDWAWPILSAVCFLLMAFWCLRFLRGSASLSKAFHSSLNRVAIACFFVAVVWQFLQALPLTGALIDGLPDATEALYRQADALLEPRSALAGALSVDASQTKASALRSASYFVLYLLLLLLVDSRERLRQLCFVLFISGFLQALYGSFMTLSGIEYLFFVEKTDYRGYATGMFVNRNHFAGYLEMTLAVGIGLMMVRSGRLEEWQKSARHSWRRTLRNFLSLLLSGKAVMRLMLVVMVIGLILSRSRMGNAAFFNSLLATGMIALPASSHARKSGAYVFLASVIAVDVFLLGSWFGLEKVVQRMEETHFSTETRVEVDRDFLPMLEAFDGLGSGAGTFRIAYPAYTGGNYSGFDHAHNDYLELLSDLGYVGAFCLAVVVSVGVWNALKALRHSGSSLVRGMGFAGFMGIFSLLLHSAVDFNLQIPANAITFIALLALPTVALSIDGNVRNARADA